MASLSFDRDRLATILRDLALMVGGSLDCRLPLTPAGDELDAISYGINALLSEVAFTRAERETAHQEIAESNQSKSQFLAAIAHDLRNPMAAILATAEHLAGLPDASEPVRQGYERIRRNGQQVLRLLEDVLAFSRVEASNVSLEEEEFSPQELVDGLVDALADAARARHNQVQIRATPPLPQTVVGDSMRLQQILSNVIGNAIKFTQSGTVEILSSWHPREAEAVLSFRVADSGIGIPDSFVEKLFTPFAQASHPGIGGSGLGLAIARRLAQALGGDLRLVETHPGRGSTFEITARMRLIGR
jgi:signal transduction histidine kinase